MKTLISFKKLSLLTKIISYFNSWTHLLSFAVGKTKYIEAYIEA